MVLRKSEFIRLALRAGLHSHQANPVTAGELVVERTYGAQRERFSLQTSECEEGLIEASQSIA